MSYNNQRHPPGFIWILGHTDRLNFVQSGKNSARVEMALKLTSK